MSINNDTLKAFLLTSELGSFTQAAARLGLTQSALSQKIARLEDRVEASLFIRKTDGISLTPAGEKLLVFARQQLQLEDEFLSSFQTGKDLLAGHLRIASYSSILRSFVIPTLSPWLRVHPAISVEFSSFEVHELVDVLKTNKADLIITDFYPHLPGTEEIKIGNEEYVLIESKKYKSDPHIYLDNFPGDNTTESYFSEMGKKFVGKRSFMGDVYGILDGVALGLGRAVMSHHLVDARFKIIKSPKKYVRPIVLSHYKQAYYPKIQKKAVELLGHFP